MSLAQAGAAAGFAASAGQPGYAAGQAAFAGVQQPQAYGMGAYAGGGQFAAQQAQVQAQAHGGAPSQGGGGWRRGGGGWRRLAEAGGADAPWQGGSPPKELRDRFAFIVMSLVVRPRPAYYTRS